jgi:hypothetical protein
MPLSSTWCAFPTAVKLVKRSFQVDCYDWLFGATECTSKAKLRLTCVSFQQTEEEL